MTQDNIKEKVIQQGEILKQIVELNKVLSDQVKATNVKVDKLAEVLAKHEVLQVEISHLSSRISHMEQLRWWLGTLTIGAIITYVLKVTLFVGA